MKRAQLADNSVGGAHIATGAVTNEKIANGAVGSNELANNSVASAHISSNAVGASEIAANAVGADQLDVPGDGAAGQFLRSDGDGSMSWATVNDGANAGPPDGSVTTAKLANSAVTTEKIANGAVTAPLIPANAVSASELNVAGNGNSSQVLGSDGDGSLQWTTVAQPSGGGSVLTAVAPTTDSFTLGNFKVTRLNFRNIPSTAKKVLVYWSGLIVRSSGATGPYGRGNWVAMNVRTTPSTYPIDFFEYRNTLRDPGAYQDAFIVKITRGGWSSLSISGRLLFYKESSSRWVVRQSVSSARDGARQDYGYADIASVNAVQFSINSNGTYVTPTFPNAATNIACFYQ